jgi:hypothetical protein
LAILAAELTRGLALSGVISRTHQRFPPAGASSAGHEPLKCAENRRVVSGTVIALVIVTGAFVTHDARRALGTTD